MTCLGNWYPLAEEDEEEVGEYMSLSSSRPSLGGRGGARSTEPGVGEGVQ